MPDTANTAPNKIRRRVGDEPRRAREDRPVRQKETADDIKQRMIREAAGENKRSFRPRRGVRNTLTREEQDTARRDRRQRMRVVVDGEEKKLSETSEYLLDMLLPTPTEPDANNA